MKCGEIFIAKYELKFFCSKLRIYLLCHLFEIITPLTSIKHSNPNQISYYLLLFFPPTILSFLWRVARAISENASISKTWRSRTLNVITEFVSKTKLKYWASPIHLVCIVSMSYCGGNSERANGEQRWHSSVWNEATKTLPYYLKV